MCNDNGNQLLQVLIIDELFMNLRPLNALYLLLTNSRDGVGL